MNETKKNNERVLIIAVYKKRDDEFEFKESLNEIVSLCETADLEVVDIITQNKDRFDSTFYIGKGKLDEIIELTDKEDLTYDCVIVGDELSTAQSKHLNEALQCKIIDRTQLILDIFASRAKSREGKLQVELAQLEYLLPRLSGHGQSLSRLGGGIGTRGPGETKLETNRRHIRSRITDIKREISAIKAHRTRYRENRKKQQFLQVALVGYTNAGKSSWFNQLTKSTTFEENLLFATLDPKSKMMSINDGFDILLSDTVGFIQKLPTHLIDAFSSTLEEAKYADVLIHLVDGSHHNVDIHIKTVNELLTSLEMNHIPCMMVYNKKDLMHETDAHYDEAVSARDIDDIQVIKQKLIHLIQSDMLPYHISIIKNSGEVISHLKNATLVKDILFNEDTEIYEVHGFERKDNGVIEQLINKQYIKKFTI